MAPTTRSKTPRTARSSPAKDTKSIGGMFIALRESPERAELLHVIQERIKGEKFPPYLQNLLNYAVLILHKELRNKYYKPDSFNRWSIWRNFNLLDQLDIPQGAHPYLQNIFSLDGKALEPSLSAWTDSFYREVARNSFNWTLPRREVRLQRLIFAGEGETAWSVPGEYDDEKTMRAEELKGTKDFGQFILGRLRAQKDVRFLSHDELEVIHDAFPVILNSLRDPHGDLMTINVAFLLQNAWNLSYKTYHDLEDPIDDSPEGLETRRDLWVEAAAKAGFLDRFYTSRIRVDEEVSQIHEFVTSFRTTGDVRKALESFRTLQSFNGKKRKDSRSIDSERPVPKRFAICPGPIVESRPDFGPEYDDSKDEAPIERARFKNIPGNTLSDSDQAPQPLGSLFHSLSKIMGCELSLDEKCMNDLMEQIGRFRNMVNDGKGCDRWLANTAVLNQLAVDSEDTKQRFTIRLLYGWVDLSHLLQIFQKLSTSQLDELEEVAKKMKEICQSHDRQSMDLHEESECH